ncbi:MAG TPA: protease inhibitor I42 family protein [Opitutaceae bacterium]|nr:protease inhibitor I42 family protein [Opitutaceae bacterium]
MRAALLLLGALFVAGCGSTGGPAARIVLDASHHDRIIRAEQGQLIELRLASAAPVGHDAATAGPRWDIDRLDGPTIVAEAAPRFEPAGPAAGSQGTTVFVFRAAQPGRAMIRLVYRYPWQQAVKGDTFLAWIHVR